MRLSLNELINTLNQASTAQELIHDIWEHILHNKDKPLPKHLVKKLKKFCNPDNAF